MNDLKILLMSRATAVWLVLMAATLLSWLIVETQDRLFSTPIYEIIGLLALAFIKVRLVIVEFMEIRDAPFLLKLSCDLWLLTSFTVLVLLCGQLLP